MKLLNIEHLSCGYGDRPVLDDVNLTVKEGETVLIVGSNGCGKSTLLKAIIGMLFGRRISWLDVTRVC